MIAGSGSVIADVIQTGLHMRRFGRITILRMLSFVTLLAFALALWFTPVKFTFELRGTAVRTSASVGDLIDVRERDNWDCIFVHKAQIIEYVRQGRVSMGTDVDVVTIKTTFFNKIRMLFCDDFSAVYYDRTD